MTRKTAKANVTPARQRSQYTCMATSLMMALQAQGVKCTEDEVNDVMGARPMKGASWEQALAAAQHYGCRATLMAPCTIEHLKKLTDDGVAVLIAWNPEGRDWSHASLVFDVSDDGTVSVADPNIPDPDETVRVLGRKEFYSKWYEKWPDYLVRRPAMAIEREISPEGKQIPVRTASQNQGPSLSMVDGGAVVTRAFVSLARSADRKKKASHRFSFQVQRDGTYFVPLKEASDRKNFAKLAVSIGATVVASKKKSPSKPPNMPGKGLAERGGAGAGRHHTRDHDVSKGRSRKPKHKKKWEGKEANHGLEFSHSGLSHFFDMNLVPYRSWNFVASDGNLVEFSNRDVLSYLSKASLKHQNRVAGALLQGSLRKEDPNAYLEKLAEKLAGLGKDGGYSGNPDGKDIYPNQIDHGHEEPLAGGTDVVRRLQNQLLHEQGNTQWQRPGSPQHPKGTRSSSNTHAQDEAVALAKRWLARNQTD